MFEPGAHPWGLALILLAVLLAWLISLPLLAALAGPEPPGWLDALGVTLWAAGLGVQALADRQLARFRAGPANRARVMDRGLWRDSRHPNHFGELCLWWGCYLITVSAGGWWTLASPC